MAICESVLEKLNPVILRAFNSALSKNKPLSNNKIKQFQSILLQERTALMHNYGVVKNQTKLISDNKVRIINQSSQISEQVKLAGCNPFNIQADLIDLDLLTDSGTSELYLAQKALIKQWLAKVSSINTFAYAGLLPRKQLDIIVSNIFGNNHKHYPVLQGRSGEHILLNALVSSGVFSKGKTILSNRPFDTTKGHIDFSGLQVKALTKLADPDRYWNSDSVFMGNVDFQALLKETVSDCSAILVTMTDNGGGGQPVSMKNYQEVVSYAMKNNLLVWLDACRIFENAFFIHVFEPEYVKKSILEIVQEIFSYADIVTLSYKKMYAHSGGAILLNKSSKKLSSKFAEIESLIQKETTVEYGLGFGAGYSGLTGIEMIEIISGLFECINPERIFGRVLQPIQLCAFLKAKYGLHCVGGGHAIYLASDQILSGIKKTSCPAEYLNAVLLSALRMRGCGLGNFLYGTRTLLNDKTFALKTAVSMDSLRLAIPRGVYSTILLCKTLSVLGTAYAQGLFSKIKGGLIPKTYEGDGFDHFKVCFEFEDEQEFDLLVKQVSDLAGKK
ncbi:MAG: beta-eliminating lyase-related protein [Candidatus Woesearchaeota archaeon]|nr:beta-eliminating lyase-related protein [Candidatus Woesearchaeota archaeon]